MIKLLIIADDLTGALDSSIYFSSKGASTLVQLDTDFSWEEIPENTQVLVVNSASRHLTAEAAYVCVREIVERAKTRGIGMIFKKVDSALRGNLGSELAAVLEHGGGRQLFLMPAYPTEGRITVAGTQYWHGIPISQTAYGKDPFEPVLQSRIRTVLETQTALPIHEVAENLPLPEREMGIVVLDACDDYQIMVRCVQILTRPQPILMGGCAGMAAALTKCLFPKDNGTNWEIPPMPLLVVSGSLHPVSQEQMAEGRRMGLPYYPLYLGREGFADHADRKALVREIRGVLQQERIVLMEVRGADEEIERNNRDAVCRQIGEIVSEIYDTNTPIALAVFGGDTLLAVAKKTLENGLSPQFEVESGVPLSLAHDRVGHSIPIVSKSGGFGSKYVIRQIMKLFKIGGNHDE